MFLAVGGGRFFSSSVSGYCKGLTLLVLGQKNEEKPMRISPWNQYRLVDEHPDSDLKPNKKQHLRGCSSFICFDCVSAGLESPSDNELGRAQQGDGLSETPVSENVEEMSSSEVKVALRSSLKRPATRISIPFANSNEVGMVLVDGNIVVDDEERRKVHWTDVTGGDLVEVREFELSENGEDDCGAANERTCACRIM